MGRPWGRRGRHPRAERGASAVEMSIIAPIFLLLIFGIVEAALWMYARNVATMAAREGASVLRVSGALGDDVSDYSGSAEEVARRRAAQVGILTSVDAQVVSVDEQTVTMRVDATYVDLVPFFDSDVSSEITVQIEQFEPDLGVEP
jgi:Flp pilus assembly protein TadG